MKHLKRPGLSGRVAEGARGKLDYNLARPVLSEKSHSNHENSGKESRPSPAGLGLDTDIGGGRRAGEAKGERSCSTQAKVLLPKARGAAQGQSAFRGASGVF